MIELNLDFMPLLNRVPGTTNMLDGVAYAGCGVPEAILMTLMGPARAECPSSLRSYEMADLENPNWDEAED